MPTITLLRGREWYARGVKSYAYNEKMEVVKTSDFKLGYEFDFELVELESLPELVGLIRDQGSRKDTAIRVHGIPRPEKLFTGLPIERNKSCLLEPEGGITLFNLDIDGWACQPFDYHRPDTGRAAILSALSDKGLGFLCNFDFVALWTQSAWTTDYLRCHLYFLLDKPVPLEKLRSWASALNGSRGEKVLDSSGWNIVQPDYIGRREVTPPLVDPLSEEERVFFVQGMVRNLSADLLLSEINKTTGGAHGTGRPQQSYSGNSWQATIAKSGAPGLPEGDINSWGFRAAAQCVAEYGPSYVRANIQSLASDMHGRAWDAINSSGVSADGRGGESDRNTYDVNRYTQYLRSACDREFGAEVDSRVDRVREAISVAAETDSFTDLLSKDTLSQCAEIQKSRPAAWAEIQAEIKSKLRGKVSITEFRKLVKKGGGGDLDEDGPPIPDEGRVKLIREVLGEFDWIFDDDDNRYVGRVTRDEFMFPEGYELRTLSDNLTDVFYHIGAQKDETVTPHFGKSCLSYLLGSLHGGAPMEEQAKWKKNIVGQQQICDADGVLWWRLDPRKSLRISKEDGISVVTSGDMGRDNPVLWYSQQKTRDRDINLDERISIEEGIDLLWKYILCNEEDRSQVVGWLITCLTDAKMQMILELIGASGAAKSSAGSALRDLIEPVSSNPFHFNPKERMTLSGVPRQDKYRILKKNAVINLDNTSGLDAKTQDFYCQITTGICADLRILYSSALESIPIKRPIILSSISPNITQPDLLSRSLRVHFSTRPEDRKDTLPEAELPISWERDRPVILGALAKICHRVLQLRNGAKGRRGIYTATMEAIYGRVEGRAQAERDYRRAQTDIVITNPFCLAFTGFMMDTFEEQGRPMLTDTPSAIYLMYKRWAEKRWGEYILVPLKCGEVVEVQIAKHGGRSNEFIPNSARGLGILFNKFSHELREVCGLKIREGRKNNGVRVRTIEKTQLL